ncbi:MAG TPA: acyl-CoA dehydrogenase family protein [Thermoleophilaceae bacterium]|jgi:alkylation response protein AidB-like acyl-CoA dehydrogenase
MFLELTPRTEAGARLCALARSLSDQFSGEAAAHDRDATYPHEHVESLKQAGYFAAPIPPAFGGHGVDSIHDLIVASTILARGNPSVAIGVNMHLIAVVNMVRRWWIALARGDERRANGIAAALREIVDERAVFAAAISEPQQDLTRPSTTASRVDAGWRIDGRKIFCTMSPAATALYTSVTFRGDDGNERYGYAFVPTDAPGLTVHDDWDALGMRASGSNSVSFDGVTVASSAVTGGFLAGEAAGYMERNLAAGLFHASASLGIAESAHSHAMDSLKSRAAGACEAPSTQAMVAESAIELAAARAALARGASLIDQHHEDHPTSHGSPEELTALFGEAQAVKTFVNDTSVRLVDRALTLAGGRGYLNGHPIARAYRDVRASAFMNPLATGRAHEFIGQVALGLEGSLS